MKIKDGLILRYVDNAPVVVPIGERSMEFNGMVRLNESGAFLWELLAKGGTVKSFINAMCAEYDVTAEQASADVQAFVTALEEAGLLEETCE